MHPLFQWSAQSIVFVLLALTVCSTAVYLTVVTAGESQLLRDITLMAFSFYFGIKSGNGGPKPTGAA